MNHMNQLTLPFLMVFLSLSLTNCEVTPGEEGAEVIEVCDCDDLLFDPIYNNFYQEVPREGYTGSCEKYHANGQLALLKHFTNGKVDGEMRSYYENGQLNEEKFFDMNFQQGDFRKYNEAGKLIFHAIFERGNQVETVYLEGSD